MKTTGTNATKDTFPFKVTEFVQLYMLVIASYSIISCIEYRAHKQGVPVEYYAGLIDKLAPTLCTLLTGRVRV